MTGYIYEKDLRMMKLRIFDSTCNRKALEEIAGMLGVSRNRLMKVMIDRFDMTLLENLADRYDTWKRIGESADGIEGQLGADLLTRYVPLLPAEEMQRICGIVRNESEDGVRMEEAINGGRQMIREVLTQ